MGSLPTSSRAPAAALGLALVLGLAGCGDDEPAPDSHTSVSWQETDICGLLDADQVATLIGGGTAPESAGDSQPRRPECVWAAGGSPQRLVLRLWQPPVPGRLAETAVRETSAGDHAGYVEREGPTTCTVHVEGEPAWLTVSLHAPEGRARDALCDEVLPTAETVLDQVP